MGQTESLAGPESENHDAFPCCINLPSNFLSFFTTESVMLANVKIKPLLRNSTTDLFASMEHRVSPILIFREFPNIRFHRAIG